uniref:Efflux RND transporter periplasmic adaptor subunit n=1 Tax=Eiseniibacteriota bacterium TaxID=2212470 RepID=A0A832I6D7_UNCEI
MSARPGASLRPAALRAAAALALAAALAGCARGGSAESGGRGNRGPQALPVAAAEVRPRDLVRSVTVAGAVEPLRVVQVNAQMAGTVVAVHVEEGRHVRAGERLAELDAREATAQLARARAILANAEAAYARSAQLAAEGLASGSELDEARAARDIARADVEVWSTRLAFSRIEAPVAGVVTAKRVERGGAVTAHQPLFEIAEDGPRVVRVRVSELDVVRLEPGRAVSVQLDAYPQARIEGRIRRIFPSADAASRLVPVEVALGPAPGGVEVRPGFLARVEFPLERRAAALAVPAPAVGVSEGETFVYVVVADTLVRRPVETGLTAEGWIEIVRGLAAGERVVSSGHSSLRPGAPVRVRDPEAGVAAPPAGADRGAPRG